MSIIIQIVDRIKNMRISFVLVGFAGVLVIIFSFFLIQKLFFSHEETKDETTDEIGQMNESAKLDMLAESLPEYSEEELEQQYRELDAEFLRVEGSVQN